MALQYSRRALWIEIHSPQLDKHKSKDGRPPPRRCACPRDAPCTSSWPLRSRPPWRRPFSCSTRSHVEDGVAGAVTAARDDASQNHLAVWPGSALATAARRRGPTALALAFRLFGASAVARRNGAGPGPSVRRFGTDATWRRQRRDGATHRQWRDRATEGEAGDGDSATGGMGRCSLGCRQQHGIATRGGVRLSSRTASGDPKPPGCGRPRHACGDATAPSVPAEEGGCAHGNADAPAGTEREDPFPSLSPVVPTHGRPCPRRAEPNPSAPIQIPPDTALALGRLFLQPPAA